MINKKPPFEITNQIIDYVAEIAELVGRLTSTNQLSANPTLRRSNRIRTIHGSLAIEQNTLSLEQVTAVLNGKHVLAPPKDIAEVKNAYEVYERLDELNPYSVEDLLTAHRIMTQGLVNEAGMFRTRPVGIVDNEGHILHFGTLPQYVPDLVMELLDWVEKSDVHILIRSCVFHYELGQYRIIWQERFARIFYIRMRRVFAAILDVLQENGTKSGCKISAKRRRHNCAVLP